MGISVAEKNEVDKNQLMEGPHCIQVNYFYCRNTREWMREESVCTEACLHLHTLAGLPRQGRRHAGDWLEIPPRLSSTKAPFVQMQINSWA